MRNVYDLAKLEIGTYEWAEGSNPRVDAYFDDVGFPSMQDDTAWCAAFVGAMLKRSGFPHTGKLTARSYIDWGKPVDLKDAKPGDVVVFWRGSPNSWQGHVALFDRADGGMIYVVGGNQRDQVNISAYPADRLLSIRRMTKTNIAQSTTVQATGVTFLSVLGMYMDAAKSVVGQITENFGVSPEMALLIVACGALAWITKERWLKFVTGDR